MKGLKLLLRTLCVALPVCFLLLGALYFAQPALLYYPNSHIGPPELYGLAMRELTLEADDGVRLTAWYAPPPENRPVIVFFGGNGGHIGFHFRLFDAFLEAGFGLFALNYRGFGGSEGSPSEQGLYRDGRAALAFLAEQGIGAGALVLYGQSLGSAVATRMALLTEAAAVVLESPFTSIPDRAGEIFRFLPVRFLVRERYDNLTRVPLLEEPLLILHGETDGVVPVGHGRRLYRAAGGPKEFIGFAGKGHNELGEEEVVAAVAEFLASHL